MKRVIYRFTLYTGSEEEGNLKEIQSMTIGIHPDTNLNVIAKCLMDNNHADEITCEKLMTCDIE